MLRQYGDVTGIAVETELGLIALVKRMRATAVIELG